MLNRSGIGRDLEADLDLALHLADFGSRLTLRRLHQGHIHVVNKADGTPVSDVDMAAESEIRRRLEVARPDDGVLGEEFRPEGNQGSRWIIDPIDGTSNFLGEDPNWAVLIALEVGGHIVAGVVSAPALGKKWWAASGFGAWADGRRLQLGRANRPLAEATITRQSRAVLDRLDLADPLRRCLEGACIAESELVWGDLLVAQGGADIDLSLNARPWAIAARKAVVTEAGARCTDIQGRDRVDTGSALAAVSHVHAELVAAINGTPRRGSARGRAVATRVTVA